MKELLSQVFCGFLILALWINNFFMPLQKTDFPVQFILNFMIAVAFIILIIDALVTSQRKLESASIIQKKKELVEILKSEPRLTKLGDYLTGKNNIHSTDFIKRTYALEKKNGISFESTIAAALFNLEVAIKYIQALDENKFTLGDVNVWNITLDKKENRILLKNIRFDQSTLITIVLNGDVANNSVQLSSF